MQRSVVPLAGLQVSLPGLEREMRGVMGTLTYDVVSRVEFDDRALAHLQIVIASKFRRNESFNFSWVKDAAHGSGRVTVWMHPSIPLVYEFSGSRMPTINRTWLDVLMQTANSATGLHLVPESTEPHDEIKI